MSSALETLRPFCLSCQRPVEKVRVIRDNFRAEVVFAAYCHGNRHTVMVTEEWLQDCDNVARYLLPQAFHIVPGRIRSARIVRPALAQGAKGLSP